MSTIGLIVLCVIVLRVIANGGSWFDVLNGQASYSNWWNDLKFTIFGYVLLIGGVLGAILLFSNYGATLQAQTAYAPAPTPIAHATHKGQAHTSVKKHPSHALTAVHHAQGGKR